MIYGLILLISLIFPNYFSGLMFYVLNMTTTYLKLDFSQSGLLAVSLQLALTVCMLFVFCAEQIIFRKFRKLNSIKVELSSVLMSILIFVFWFFLIFRDYEMHANLSMTDAIENLRSQMSIFHVILRWAISLLFSGCVIFLLVSFFKKVR